LAKGRIADVKSVSRKTRRHRWPISRQRAGKIPKLSPL